MKRLPRTSSAPLILPQSVQRRLNMYALAASAAGVSLLASAQPTEAKVVYTKTHQVIGTNGIYALDLNHDGTIDFLIQEWTSVYSELGRNALLVQEALGNAVAGSIVKHSSQSFHFASALKVGAQIGSRERFIHGGYDGEEMVAVFVSDSGGGTFGKWVDRKNRYLGLRFKVDGKTHYGWARMSVKVQGFDITGTLTGYAYETVPNKGILAGQTEKRADGARDRRGPTSYDSHAPSLGRLARGTQGLPPKGQP